MDINDRVKLYMEHIELTSSEFAERAGIQASTFSHFINGRNKASLDVVLKIDQAFTDVNLGWLLYGEGEMLKTNSPTDTGTPNLFSSSESDLPNPSAIKPAAGISMDGFSAMTQAMVQNAQLSAQPAAPVKPPRKIREIRVFFDDNTYEIFKVDK